MGGPASVGAAGGLGARLESARIARGSSPFDSMAAMIRISDVQPLEGRVVRRTLTDGSVVERDLSVLLDGVGVFHQTSFDDNAFREVYVDYGTLVCPARSISPQKR